ncbi:MAG: hypothetical protein AAGI34_07625 [Pseudomonadota bacterium]
MAVESDTISASTPGAALLGVHGLQAEGTGPVDFVLRRGEILGLTGLPGAGHAAIGRSLASALGHSGAVRSPRARPTPDCSAAQPLSSAAHPHWQDLGRRLCAGRQVLIVEEAPVGSDVTALRALMQATLAKGHSVLLISNDGAEIAALCHRALVFARGRVVCELGAQDLSAAALRKAAGAPSKAPQPTALPNAVL